MHDSKRRLAGRIAIPLIALIPLALAFALMTFQTASYTLGVIVPQYALYPAYSYFHNAQPLGAFLCGGYTMGTWVLVVLLYWRVTAGMSLARSVSVFMLLWVLTMAISHGLLLAAGCNFVLDTV